MEKKQLLWILPPLYALTGIVLYFLVFDPSLSMSNDSDRLFVPLLILAWTSGTLFLFYLIWSYIKGKSDLLRIFFDPFYKK